MWVRLGLFMIVALALGAGVASAQVTALCPEEPPRQGGLLVITPQTEFPDRPARGAEPCTVDAPPGSAEPDASIQPPEAGVHADRGPADPVCAANATGGLAKALRAMTDAMKAGDFDKAQELLAEAEPLQSRPGHSLLLESMRLQLAAEKRDTAGMRDAARTIAVHRCTPESARDLYRRLFDGLTLELEQGGARLPTR